MNIFKDYSYRDLVPILTPAIEKNECEIDHKLLVARILVVALAAIATTALASIFAPTYPLVVFLINATPISIFIIDYLLSDSGVNEKAVNEYLNTASPSHSATVRITSNFKAAKAFVDKKCDFKKKNVVGENPLSYFYMNDFNIFKLFIDSGSIKFSLDINDSFIFNIIKNKNSSLLEYILKSGKIKSTELNEDNQALMWSCVENIKSGQLLKKYGFNVNCRNSDGYTPLLRAAPSNFMLKYSPNIAGKRSLVKILLECGADKTLTVNIKGKELTAAQINKDPEIAEMLK